ncbi:MAG: AMP-binding protein [candidate division Zixibacteria bacterium]|nr:AMP-binding protein [candidate division Zixibacteria bacterium]
MCAKRRNPEPGQPSGVTDDPSGHPDPARQDQAWREFVARSRRESLPFEEHLAAFRRIFDGRRPEDGPPAVWTPDEETVRRSNLQASMTAVGIDRYADFHAWSVRDLSAFWTHTLERLAIVFTKPPDAILDLDGGVHASRGARNQVEGVQDAREGKRAPKSMPRGGVRDPRWLPGAELNIVDSCFTTDPDRPAVVTPGSNSPDGPAGPDGPDAPDDSGAPDVPDDQALRTTTYGGLERLVNRLANGLRDRGLAPDQAIALYMPLNLECVAAYLAIIRAGSRVVSIADSFPPTEIRRRMAIAGASCAVTMDRYVHAGKVLPHYATVVEAGASKVIVVPSGGCGWSGGNDQPGSVGRSGGDGRSCSDAPRLRPGDISWTDLLAGADTFESVTGDPYRTSNVLFSSGTTGEPKAIPWNHLTPIKSAMDGFYHQDIHADDVTTWPTNVGWMMGPWLIYATLVNGACMALYPGAANTPEYLRFIRRARVTMQGVIPSLVRTWRRSGVDDVRQGGVAKESHRGMTGGGGITDADGMTDGIVWPSIRVFSSTGEPANRTDYLWLMSRAGYRAPVIEYLGGTEIGGGHLACTVLQPCSPAAFSTANLGVDFVILDESGAEVGKGDTGELLLMPPALGMSQRLLNGDHDEVYYEGCPAGPRGEILRRHGDHTQRLHHGYFRSQGRADDGMNLGGIMVSPLELERIIDGHPAVYESAAVAMQPEGEGAERLVVFIVPEDGIGAAGSRAAGSRAAGSRAADSQAGLGRDLDRDPDPDPDLDTLKSELQAMVSSGLNPLFKIYRVVIVDELPHTASGKLVRRILRDRMRPGS